LLEVVVLEAVALPVIVFVICAEAVIFGDEDDVLLTVELRVVVCVLVIVFVEVADKVVKRVGCGD
jgi:hypothetical protein